MQQRRSNISDSYLLSVGGKYSKIHGGITVRYADNCMSQRKITNGRKDSKECEPESFAYDASSGWPSTVTCVDMK
jgi:hypothetical protein